MRLVPSGNLKVMVAQTLAENPEKDNLSSLNIPKGIKPQDLPQPRNQVVQEQVGEQPETPKAQVQPESQPEVPEVQTPGKEVQVQEQTDQPDKSQALKKHMMSVFFDIVKNHFGVNPEEVLKQSLLRNRSTKSNGAAVEREINTKLQSLFDVSIQNPLSEHPVLKGFFVIPNKRNNDVFDYNDPIVTKAASEFCKKYGLDATSAEADKSAAGWRFNFITHDIQGVADAAQAQTGTSYDAVLGLGGQKEAQTMSEMLKESQDQRFGSLTKYATKTSSPMVKIASGPTKTTQKQDGPITMAEMLTEDRNSLYETMSKIIRK